MNLEREERDPFAMDARLLAAELHRIEGDRNGIWILNAAGGEPYHLSKEPAPIRSFDWSGTSLGAAESWPQSLKTAVRVMLTSRQPWTSRRN